MKTFLLFTCLLVSGFAFGQTDKVFISHKYETVSGYKLLVTITNTGTKPFLYTGSTIISSDDNGKVLSTDQDKQRFVIAPRSSFRFTIVFSGDTKDLISINLYK